MTTTPRDFKYLFFLSPQQFVESVTAAVACEIKPEMIKNTAMHMIDGILPFNLSLPKLCICKHNFLRNTNTCRFIFLLFWAFPLYFLKYSSNLSSKNTSIFHIFLLKYKDRAEIGGGAAAPPGKISSPPIWGEGKSIDEAWAPYENLGPNFGPNQDFYFGTVPENIQNLNVQRFLL